MSQRIWKLRWQAAVLFVAAIACGYWTAGACAPATVVQNNTCEQLPDGSDETNGFQIQAHLTSGQGRQLAFTRRVMTNPQDGSMRIASDVTSDGELVMTWTLVTTVPNRVEAFIEYGPAVCDSADPTANFLVENGFITGLVEGRDLVPVAVDQFDPNNVLFEDGGPIIEMDVDADLETALADLFAVARQTADTCQAQNGNTAKQAHRHQDSGHDSDPETDPECPLCWLGCSGAAGACAGIATAACSATALCWPCFAVCETVALAGCTAAYISCVDDGCNGRGGSPCCPVTCGAVACCDTDEKCLNSTIGLCCSPGKTPCAGEMCCDSTESCISEGPNAGTCCQPEDICGDTCCNPTDSCIPEESLCCPSGMQTCDDKCCDADEDCLGDGLCCEPQDTCGSACCDELDSCIESLSLCCGFNEPACNDRCCDSGESCLNGVTCCPSNLICGNVCCPQGTHCDPQTMACEACPNITDNACPDGGCCPAGKVCSGPPGTCCNQGEIYCKGACHPAAECIQ
jgi:hypothetical protein